MATIADRCALLLPRLTPAQFFSHTTAADAWGIPLPPRCAFDALHVGAIPPAREPRIAGVQGHRIALGWDLLTLAQGLPVPLPAIAWGQLGSMLRLEELVVAADFLLREGLADAHDLRASVQPGCRGAVNLRLAADLARPGSESPRETETRLELVLAGLPEPELNWVLRDRSGRFVARLDMAYPRFRVAVEYDGRHHADAEQFARDADRWASIQALDWTLIRVVSHHFERPSRDIVAPVRRALRARGLRT